MDEEKLSRRKDAQKKKTRPWWKKFRRKHGSVQDTGRPESAEEQESVEETTPHLSRSQTRSNREINNDDEKRKRLGKRLDLVIVVLVVLIILVYLFMRFVNI